MLQHRSNDTDRLPGLDGLRAVSIVLVLLFHLISLPGMPTWGWFLAIADRGQFGVEIFFVLSGFIITWLLLKEEARTGSIDLRQFYIRRAFRILPPAFVFLAFIAVLVLAHRSFAHWGEIISAALFTRNFFVSGTPDTGHFWSLAVEEQFYLTWPFLFALLGKRSRVALLIGLLGISPVWRHEYFRIFPHARINVFEFHYEPLLMGCLLALLRPLPRVSAVCSRRLFQSAWTFTACVVIIALLLSPLEQHVSARTKVFFPLAQYLCVALIINYLIQGGRSPINWMMNTAPVVYVGKLSYSLYLWQQPFCFSGSAMALRAPWGVVPAVLGALFSYYAIEQPALRLRQTLRRGRRIEASVQPVFEAVHVSVPAPFQSEFSRV